MNEEGVDEGVFGRGLEVNVKVGANWNGWVA